MGIISLFFGLLLLLWIIIIGVCLFIMGLIGLFFDIRLLFWIFIIVVAYLIIKHPTNHNKTRSVEEKSGLDIAKERYAKGEITKEEFEEIKKNLI